MPAQVFLDVVGVAQADRLDLDDLRHEVLRHRVGPGEVEQVEREFLQVRLVGRVREVRREVRVRLVPQASALLIGRRVRDLLESLEDECVHVVSCLSAYCRSRLTIRTGRAATGR
jgi:hypothetical protein